MRLLSIVIVLALFTTASLAADKDTGKTTQKSPVASEVKNDTGQKSTQKKRTPEWPRPYKSTEKISVDSIVPFPTDI